MKARGFSKDRYFQGDVEDVEKLVLASRGASLRASLGRRPPDRRRVRQAILLWRADD
jgi:hypothetical protein